MKEINSQEVFSIIKKRRDDANKGDFGKLMIIAGCSDYRGAAYLSVAGALRCGTGIVSLASTEKVISSVSSRVAECTYIRLSENEDGAIGSKNAHKVCEAARKYTAVLAGCGLGLFDDTRTFVRELIGKCEAPLILDADALNSIKDDPGILREAAHVPIITPHVGEFARLCKKETSKILADPEKNAVQFAEKYRCTLILKNHFTVIAAPGRDPAVSRFGNVGLAKGGSGDLLAGIVSSFRAQGYSEYESAGCGVYVHGRAADICAERMSYTSMLPSDVARCIDKVFFENGR